MNGILSAIVKKQKLGQLAGIASICSANKFVLKAAMLHAQNNHLPLLIEQTANQVDQFGGYSGMNPAEFIKFIEDLAAECNFPVEAMILGGDHLGPLTQQHQPEAVAMAYAEDLVRAYVLAGFTKIHLDTSMKLASDPFDSVLSEEIIAQRGARLCRAAEAAYLERKLKFPSSAAPFYVIGSEVPTPGGTQSNDETTHVTRPEQCQLTIATYQKVFLANGLQAAFDRVIALVVQTGAEFGDEDVFPYDSAQAAALAEYGKKELSIVFEGHSTDYQTPDMLRRMVSDGIAILKVGPALTFALREALFALESMENELYHGKEWPKSNFKDVLENAMLNEPKYWENYYHGDAQKLWFSRRYSYSDRARYYLQDRTVVQSIDQLIKNIDESNLPGSLISQYLPTVYRKIRPLKQRPTAEQLILEQIGCCLDDYLFAIQ